MRIRPRILPLLLAAFPAFRATPAHAYIDLAPTLAKQMNDAQQIRLIEVVSVDAEKRTATYKVVRAIKGPADAKPETAKLSWPKTAPQQFVQWATPGAQCVLMINGDFSEISLGTSWYQARVNDNGVLTLGVVRPDLPLAYYGSVSRLAFSMVQMLAGKEAILPVVAYGVDDEGASFDLALNRPALPGLVRIQRIRARLNMPNVVMASSASPAYLVGPGPTDLGDLPSLLAVLASPDAAKRADAADDIGSLNHKAVEAASSLAKLLSDTDGRARMSAAGALLRVGHKSLDAGTLAKAVDVLKSGLTGSDPGTRIAAARVVGLCGAASTPLVEPLTALLAEKDPSLRLAAIQSVATLGPVASRSSEALVKLLDDAPEFTVDAADALGRIGKAARPAQARLAELLESTDLATVWAGVRAMSQIGGADAKPAVDYMIRQLPTCSEVDGYNMMIYLALIGPDAKDAINAISNARIKNPVLPTATLWAIDSDKSLPWQTPNRRGFGFGGGVMGGDNGPEFARLIYENYVHELGDRLKPCALNLAKKILDNTAGDVPSWGFKILAAAPEEVLALLLPHLADEELVARERAAVALGFMGPAAAAAHPLVEKACAKSTNPREKNLLKWCLKEITAD